eukprot:tig00021015_g17145.t1
MKRGREVDEALAKVERAETELVKARAELAEVLLALERPAAATTPETATASRDMELVELIDITDSESDEPGPSTPAASYLHEIRGQAKTAVAPPATPAAEIHVLKQVLEPCPSPVANVAFARGACRAPRPFPPRREPGAPAIKREAGAPAIKREHEACAAPPAAPQAEPGAPAIKREAGAPAINCKRERKAAPPAAPQAAVVKRGRAAEAPPAAATAAERPPHSAPSARPVFVKREPEAPHAARPVFVKREPEAPPARPRPARGHASSSLLRPRPRRGCRAGGGSDNGHRARRTRALSGPAVSDSIVSLHRCGKAQKYHWRRPAPEEAPVQEPPPPGPLDIVGMVPIEIDLDMDPILACPRGPMVPVPQPAAPAPGAAAAGAAPGRAASVEVPAAPAAAAPAAPTAAPASPPPALQPLGGSFSQPSAALAVPAAPALMFTHALELPTEALQRVGPQRPAHALPALALSRNDAYMIASLGTAGYLFSVYGRHARWERLHDNNVVLVGTQTGRVRISNLKSRRPVVECAAGLGPSGETVPVAAVLPTVCRAPSWAWWVNPGLPAPRPAPLDASTPDPTAEGRWIYCTFAASGTSLLALFMPSAELLNVQPPEGAGPTPDCTLAQLDLAGTAPHGSTARVVPGGVHFFLQGFDPARRTPPAPPLPRRPGGPPPPPPLPFGLPPVDLPEEETRLAQLVAVTFEDRLVLARLRPLPAGPVPMALQIVHAAPLPRATPASKPPLSLPMQ